MKVSDIPHNMNYEEDEDFLEIPEDSDEMKKGVDFLLDEMAKTEDLEKKGKIAVMAGIFSRIISNLDASEKLINEAIGYFEEAGKHLLKYYAQSRLGATYSAMGKYKPAEELFKGLMKELAQVKKNPAAKKISVYCFEQMAKSKYHQHFYQEALDIYVEAHERQLAHGDIDNIQKLSDIIARLRTLVAEQEAEQAREEEEKRQIEEDFKNRTDV